MSVGTARVAGVEHIVACAPPRDASGMYPHTLYALHASGADEIYHLGGVQAFAAMAYGCVGMPAVDMVTGAGNAYVAEAKRQLFGTVGIDLLAGPDRDPGDRRRFRRRGARGHRPAGPGRARARQPGVARHDLARPGRGRASGRSSAQLPALPTRAIAEAAWRDHGEVVVARDDDEAIAISDRYAPEHLEVQTRRNDYYLEKLRNYGSLFVGEESTVAYGDKGVGTNHTLPTAAPGATPAGSGSASSSRPSRTSASPARRATRIAPIVSRICEAEGMMAHKFTADVRTQRYD